MPKKSKLPLAVIVGANITAKRKRKGWNQAQFAEQIGIGSDSLSRIERGITTPRFQTLEKMSLVLECPVAEFFLTGTETALSSLAEMLADPESARSEVIVLAEKIIQIARARM